MCDRCVGLHNKAVCAVCYFRHWTGGKACFRCVQNKRRFERQKYGYFCKTCYYDVSQAGREEALREESLSYEVARNSKDERPNGKEPAIQGLLNFLPGDPNTDVPLAVYAAQPEYLAPIHCRICLADCTAAPANASAASLGCKDLHYETGVHPHVAAHVSAAHGMDVFAYRKHVMTQEVRNFPQPVPSQVLRTRLTAFKQLQTDADFAQGVCACCARARRQKDLVVATFVSENAEEPPSWLGWSAEAWRKHRRLWWNQVNETLNVEQYLKTYFLADGRVADAEAARLKADDDLEEQPADAHHIAQQRLAASWYDRVIRWRNCLREDLRSDGVAAPGAPEDRWMLYRGGILLDGCAQDVRCHLCTECSTAFRNRLLTGKPQVRLPLVARARGMWQGPEPEVIRSLSYAERRILRLARVYTTIKRVSKGAAIWAKDNEAALPQYTTRNAVAYAQDPDAVLLAVGLMPAQLKTDLLVQFEGSDKSIIAKDILRRKPQKFNEFPPFLLVPSSSSFSRLLSVSFLFFVFLYSSSLFFPALLFSSFLFSLLLFSSLLFRARYPPKHSRAGTL